MSIRQVREVPSKGASQTKESFVSKEMREFVRTGMSAAVVEVEGRSPKSVDSAVRNWLKAHPRDGVGIKVGVRQGRVYVWRED